MQVDTLPDPDGEAVISNQTQGGGGSASNTAVVLAGLDFDPLLLGSVADDENGHLARRELVAAGVDCTPLEQVTGGATTVKYIVVDETGEVMILANEGANEAFTAADLPDDALSNTGHLHLTSQSPQTALTLAKRATAADVPVSLAPGRRLGYREYGDTLEYADIVFLNSHEEETAREAGLLDGIGAEIVVTRGSEGAARYGRETSRHEGFDAQVVDTAGAGDAFAAGYLAARYTDRVDASPLAVANACGAIAAESLGARTPLSWDAVRDRLD